MCIPHALPSPFPPPRVQDGQYKRGLRALGGACWAMAWFMLWRPPRRPAARPRCPTWPPSALPGSCPSTSSCALAGGGLEVSEDFLHAGSGIYLRSSMCCRCFGPTLSPHTLPRCWGAAQRAPGLMALASPSMWIWIAALVQTVECSLTWSRSVGFFSAALVPWMVLMDSTCWSRQQLACAAALPLVTGHRAILYRWIHQR